MCPCTEKLCFVCHHSVGHLRRTIPWHRRHWFTTVDQTPHVALSRSHPACISCPKTRLIWGRSFVPLRLHSVEISTSGFLSMARQFTRLIGLHSTPVETNPLTAKKKSIATAHKRGRLLHFINLPRCSPIFFAHHRSFAMFPGRQQTFFIVIGDRERFFAKCLNPKWYVE